MYVNFFFVVASCSSQTVLKRLVRNMVPILYRRTAVRRMRERSDLLPKQAKDGEESKNSFLLLNLGSRARWVGVYVDVHTIFWNWLVVPAVGRSRLFCIGLVVGAVRRGRWQIIFSLVVPSSRHSFSSWWCRRAGYEHLLNCKVMHCGVCNILNKRAQILNVFPFGME